MDVVNSRDIVSSRPSPLRVPEIRNHFSNASLSPYDAERDNDQHSVALTGKGTHGHCLNAIRFRVEHPPWAVPNDRLTVEPIDQLPAPTTKRVRSSRPYDLDEPVEGQRAPARHSMDSSSIVSDELADERNESAQRSMVASSSYSPSHVSFEPVEGVINEEAVNYSPFGVTCHKRQIVLKSVVNKCQRRSYSDVHKSQTLTRKHLESDHPNQTRPDKSITLKADDNTNKNADTAPLAYDPPLNDGETLECMVVENENKIIQPPNAKSVASLENSTSDRTCPMTRDHRVTAEVKSGSHDSDLKTQSNTNTANITSTPRNIAVTLPKSSVDDANKLSPLMRSATDAGMTRLADELLIRFGVFIKPLLAKGHLTKQALAELKATNPLAHAEYREYRAMCSTRKQMLTKRGCARKREDRSITVSKRRSSFRGPISRGQSRLAVRALYSD